MQGWARAGKVHLSVADKMAFAASPVGTLNRERRSSARSHVTLANTQGRTRTDSYTDRLQATPVAP